MAGVDIRTVADLMGHSTIQMTMRYAHLAPEHTQAAVDVLVQRTGTTTGTGKKTSKAKRRK
jgi:site-specific recombinase XerD